MDLSFREKSLWLLFVGLIVIFGIYFSQVLPPESSNVEAGQIAQFMIYVALLIVLQIAGNVVFAIFDRRHDTDERDRYVGLIGARNAWYVLAVGVMASIAVALLTDGNFLFTHVLLAALVLAQLMEIGSQLVLYRRGS